ncbi:MAG: LamG domain-containing protein, partial [Planctomycetes bacterium]|nr:LamG domain-containing protein [Planctomycetota bacterium]
MLGLFFVSFASAVIPDDCESSVVAYWKFDGDATEEINEYDGSLGGTAEVYGSAKVGEYSLGLSAGTDTFTIPDNLDLKPSGGLSIEFWIQKSESVPPVLSIINKQGYSISTTFTTLTATIGTITLEGTIDADGSTWNHVVITWDGATAKLYVDNSEADSQSLADISYGTDDLIVGGGFIGLIDELAIYNEALSPTTISSHYSKSSGGDDYCYVASGSDTGDSETQTDFTISGCDLGDGGLAADSCSFDGNWFCGDEDGNYVLYNTLYDERGCAFGGTSAPVFGQPQCCPIGFVCVDDPDEGLVCMQRLEECANQTTRGDCEAIGCYWLNNICVDRPADYSCDVYDSESACLNDSFHLGQTGVGTEVCGTYFVVGNDGYVIPFDTCRCDWDGAKCALGYDVLEEIHGGNPNSFRCVKGFDIGDCIEGTQIIKWGVVPQVISGYISGIADEILIASGCVENV